MVQLSHLYMTTGKALTVQICVGKVMSLLLNTLYRFVIAFLPRSKHLNFMAAVTMCNDFGAQENKICHCFPFCPFYSLGSDGTSCLDLSFFNIGFQANICLLSSFTLIKRLFSSFSLSAIRMVSSAYLRLLIFLMAILIPACASSSQPFSTMYSVYKLNKQGDNIQPHHIPFPVLNQFVVPCPVLTVASWPAYRLFRRLFKWSGIPFF